ncbi:hypothetical protein FBUS_01431 [Fasciolopsis buskii]|uniref:Uncharacterized protein n=1 Tax=Fasciolopsis buskii TaxID=27845 RepID=A0A8E0RT84_9TREM|nr:hypothetical protein FBUS_01431 [Fasciolopsis buski]
MNVAKPRARKSTVEMISPADVLLYCAIIVAVPGLVLIIAGIVLGLSAGGVSGHYSLTYVGLALFVASLITMLVAIKRIVQTNRCLNQLGLSASEFMSQWNAQNETLPRCTSMESRLTAVEPIGEEALTGFPDRLPMPPKRAVLG